MPGSDNSEDELYSKVPDENKEKKHLLGRPPDGDLENDGGSRWERFKGLCSCPSYPVAVFFILVTEFCERFSFYGMRTVLTLYLKNFLGLGGKVSTEIFHGFNTLCYFTPLLGAILADGYIGKFRTILYLSMIYVAGNIVMSLTAIPPPHIWGAILGLILIGIGTGGIKPCVSSFGGDQFPLDQEKQLTQFFSIFYFSINAGALLSTFITPILREDVHCFGGNCFFLAFGLPALLMITAIVIFISGRKLYKVNLSTGNVLGMFFNCIWSAFKNKVKSKPEDKRSSVLDYADDRFDRAFVLDVKVVLMVLVMFLPIPVFWALFDQQGSTWTIQAERMDGHVGTIRVKPDQMQAINTILIIVLIPLFEGVIYPLLDKCKIPNRPLQRMCSGMVLAACAFVFAAFIQFSIDASELPPLESGGMRARYINAVPCPTKFKSELNTTVLEAYRISKRFNVDQSLKQAEVSISSECSTGPFITKATLPYSPDTDLSLIVGKVSNGIIAKKLKNDLVKPRGGLAKVRFIYLSQKPTAGMEIRLTGDEKHHYVIGNISEFEATQYHDVESLGYTVQIASGGNTRELGEASFRMGGCYTVVVHEENATPEMSVYVDVPPNTVSMMLQIPQYVIITTGEILLSVTGLSFAYSEAPVSMKSVLQAFWLLTVAFGNLIVLIFAFFPVGDSVANSLFFYAGLMAIDIIIFAILACMYTYRKDRVPIRDDETELHPEAATTEDSYKDK